MSREKQLARAFVELADTMVADYDVADLLHRLVTECVDLLDVAAAGLLLADAHGRLQVLASSTERARLLELFQLQNDDGPCLEAYRTAEAVLVEDLRSATQRWPTFAVEAVRDGFVSMSAVPLRLRDETIGALNLFGSRPGKLTPDDLELARGLADIATIGILHERAIRRGEVLTEQLQTALNTRVIIEQAKGALAQAGGSLDMDDAFKILRKYARDTNTRLGDAATMIANGDVDPRTVIQHHTPAR
jgi:GAF domain-containing protein